MTYVVAVARVGKRADSTEPNDFIFHSSYNTYKIVRESTMNIVLAASTNDQSFSQAHAQGFIPLVDGFAKRAGVAQVFRPNGIDVELWGPKLGFVGDIKFNYIAADANNVIVNFDNAKASTVSLSVRYFCLEKVD